MKRLLILTASFILMTVPITSQTLNGTADTVTAAIPAAASSTQDSNAAASIPAVALIIALAAVYALHKGIQQGIRSVQYQGSQKKGSPLIILELIQSLLGIIFPAITAVLLTLHLSGVIPYISVTEEIAGVLLSAGITVCEILDAFLKKRQTADAC
jgi:ABC-type Fe3+ transport system permease subunit